MPSATDIDEFYAAQNALSARAVRDLSEFWSGLDLERPKVAKEQLVTAVPVITTVYGEASAVLAADWYDDMRLTSRVPGRFRAVMAAPFAAEYVARRVDYGARHLFTGAPGQTLEFLDGAVNRYVLQPGRETIRESAAADPRAVGWKRETRPSRTFPSGCGFCNVLAGRGGVYKWDVAPFASHDDCHCVASPSWDQDAIEVPVDAYVASIQNSQLSPEARKERMANIRAMSQNIERRR